MVHSANAPFAWWLEPCSGQCRIGIVAACEAG